MVCKSGGMGVKSLGAVAEKICTSGTKGSMPCSTGGDDNQKGGELLVQLITNHLLDLKTPHNA